MKTLYAIFTLIILSIPTLGQEQTFLGSTELEHGGFGAPVMKLTTVNNDYGILLGGRCGWIINHTLSIGFAGYGLANNVKTHGIGPDGQTYLEFGYGGLDLELIAGSNDLIHFSVNTLIGGGTVGFRNGWENDMDDDEDMWGREMDHDDHSARDLFFIVEPGANLDLNVVPWFRTSFGASYRYITGVHSTAATNNSLNGLSGSITFRFGRF